jgi:hypothetical protein
MGVIAVTHDLLAHTASVEPDSKSFGEAVADPSNAAVTSITVESANRRLLSKCR